MQFKSSLLVLLTVASGTSIHASPTVTKTITSAISARSYASCKCLRALADEGVACAAAALADGCNLAADFSYALDLAIAICHVWLVMLWDFGLTHAFSAKSTRDLQWRGT
ncbi:hypothetical protein B0H13DRAFT_1903054 [Mycena leptocephala]|nr:hypothetical protein B0H13DRAFT_1903054 [Mycena leptocephala]